MPLLIKKFPDFKLILTGGGFKKKYPWLINKNIVPKQELYNLIFNSMCMCVPLKFGSGTRVKIIEALSIGSIVISSKKGIEGIELLRKKPPYVYNNTKNFLEILNNLTEKDFSDIGKIYVDQIEKISKKNKYFTNKMPGNFINIGLIKLSLPNAKFIHCERNPLDTCFSCYKTFFSEGNLFSYSLEELGSFYNLYEKQMDYYKKVFAQEILNIKYEEVVSDVKKETKKNIRFPRSKFWRKLFRIL